MPWKKIKQGNVTFYLAILNLFFIYIYNYYIQTSNFKIYPHNSEKNLLLNCEI